MLKKTKTRENVIHLLENSPTPLTANEIFDKLKDKDITLSSIYRTLDTFTREKLIIKNTNDLGIATYTIQKDEHCHYLECKNCHDKIKLDYCPYDKANAQIKKNSQFEVDEHNVVIYGTCKDCQKTK